MHIYSAGQWVLLFFFYCFCGWIWECCYVSARQRHWVNRGFLYGPLLPIYGSGAILILFVTLPVQHSLPLIWLFGMLAATALELATGAAMERIFHMRYWDYSYRKIQYHGYICLHSSIGWGFFSILLVRLIHPPVSRLLADVPPLLVDPLAYALTIAFTVDVVRSVQAALNLRDLLTRLTEENEDLRRLAKRAEVAVAFAEDDLKRFRARTEVDKLLLEERFQMEQQRRQESFEQHKQRRQEWEVSMLQLRAQAKLEALHAISEAVEETRDHIDTLSQHAQEHLDELRDILSQVHSREDLIRRRTDSDRHHWHRILRSHPSASANRKYAEALENLRKLIDR